MAHWTVPLEAGWFSLTSGSDRWTPPAADRPSIPAALRANENAAAFLARILLTDGRVVLHIEDDQSGGLSQGVVNLNSAFVSGGTIQLAAAGASFRVALADEEGSTDTSEPYSWTWADADGGSDITALRAALPETGGNTPATLTLWDGEGEDPFTDEPEPAGSELVLTLHHAGTRLLSATSSWRNRAGVVAEGGVPAGFLRQDAAGDASFGGSGFDFGDGAGSSTWNLLVPQFTAGIEGVPWTLEKADGTVLLAIETPPAYSSDVLGDGSNNGGYTQTIRNSALFDALTAEVAAARDLVFRAVLSADHELGVSFAGTASGALTAALTHTEVAEAIELAPAFAGSAAGTLAAALRHNEVAEAIELRPAFAGSAAGTLDIAQLVHFMGEVYELAPAFAGSAAGTLTATLTRRQPVQHPLAPAFAGSAAGTLVALLRHNEVAEAIEIVPAFAGSAAGTLAAVLRHNEVAEAIELAPAFAGTASGALVALLRHGEVAEAFTLRPGFLGRATGALAGRLSYRRAGEEFRAEETSTEPALAILTCIEFRHPSVGQPVRVVNDDRPRSILGQTYTATRFEATLASDEHRQAPRAEIRMGNVGRLLSDWIEQSGGGEGGTARVFQVLNRPGAAPEWDLTLDILRSAGDSADVRFELGFDPLLGRPAVALRYDPQTAPGLF